MLAKVVLTYSFPDCLAWSIRRFPLVSYVYSARVSGRVVKALKRNVLYSKTILMLCIPNFYMRINVKKGDKLL